jgi:hypothetical protein
MAKSTKVERIVLECNPVDASWIRKAIHACQKAENDNELNAAEARNCAGRIIAVICRFYLDKTERPHQIDPNDLSEEMR